MNYQNAKVWLSNFEGSGPLSIMWRTSPYDAVEPLNDEWGVGFFAPNGDLTCVEFLDVKFEKDHQVLEFRDYTVEATVKKGKVTFRVHEKKSHKRKAA